MSRSHALNFAPQAIADFRSYPFEGMPITRGAYRWIADLLERAEVFILPDCGELLDRSRLKPEVPGLMFRPPFPVVACEYTAMKASRQDDFYTSVPCSKRISLAWNWTGDLPPILRDIEEYRTIRDGVAVISLFYVDQTKTWIANTGASHLPFEGEWQPYLEHRTPFMDAMIERGDLSKANSKGKGFETACVPLMLENILAAEQAVGSRDAVYDAMRADNNDEINAYVDLCYALACKNVSADKFSPSQILNRERRRKRKPELKDFHILSLGDAHGGTSASFGDRSGPRSHLRRGHIRRLSPERITWVNQTMVHGRGGFVDKTYRMKGAA